MNADAYVWMLADVWTSAANLQTGIAAELVWSYAPVLLLDMDVTVGYYICHNHYKSYGVIKFLKF